MKPQWHILAAIQAVENNLAEEWSIGRLAELGLVSPMQLYRNFCAATGHSVKEYIRKRRLSNALSFVKHSDLSLADIAYSCGYSSQQAFCRSVKSATGLTPLAYKASDRFYYFPMFNRERRRQIAVQTETLPQTVRWDYRDPQLTGIENRAVSRFISLYPGYAGRLFGRNGRQSGSQFTYELYFEESHAELLPMPVTSERTTLAVVPERTSLFAKTRVPNREEEINDAWDDMYSDWLKTSMFEQADSTYLEEYVFRNGEIRRLVLYLPVRKREDSPNIRVAQREAMRFLVSRKTGENAEERAAEAVLSFLSDRYPHLVKSSREFYTARDGAAYTCGVMLDRELRLPPDSGMELLSMESGDYAILEGDCCGDSAVYERMLLTWAADNGMMRDRAPIFTVYLADGGFELENIRTRCFLRLNNGKNG